ncbi:MAG TPA: GspH/FimT family pseudopilin, partial [Candidatus Acidoferrales bacterium]|nr:GspH/FimT family pseudopilin [Candidatus Acidoferrales bacterium]
GKRPSQNCRSYFCTVPKAFRASTVPRFSVSTRRCAFTLIELILVLALLVIITSIAAPPMAKFIRGRALDTEARRLIAFMHEAQSRAVSEGEPMMLWINAQSGAYGLAAESSGQNGDAKAEALTVDSTVAIAVLNTGTGAQTLFNGLPAIRFLADGTVDENSPQVLKLMDSDGFSRVLTETRLRTGYEVTASGQ